LTSSDHYSPPEIYQNGGVVYDSDVVDNCVKVFAEKEFCF
jgi:hypothetical protein